jgi:hypothetical protein
MDAIETMTAYGPVQVTPVVCVRCNDVSFITAPSDVPTFCAVARAITRAHRRCRFKPMDRQQVPAEEWGRRWDQAFRWIALQEKAAD